MTKTERFNKRVEDIAEDFECPKSRVLRVAVALLVYCLDEEAVSYFHYVEKLQDKDF